MLRWTAEQGCTILNEERTEGVREGIRRCPTKLSKGSLLRAAYVLTLSYKPRRGIKVL